MEGHGNYIYKSTGDVYAGNFVNGYREGFGKYTCANGDVYIGESTIRALPSPSLHPPPTHHPPPTTHHPPPTTHHPLPTTHS